MKFTHFLATFTLVALPSLAFDEAEPITGYVTGAKRSGLEARASPLITMCESRGFQAPCTTWVGDTGTCYSPLPDNFVNHLLSAKAASGLVCSLYTGTGCTGSCEACVDAGGWNDMNSFAAVRSFRCVAADAAGCSNSGCSHH